MKKSFYLYQSQEEVFDSLTNEDAGSLIKAIFDHERGIKIDLKPELIPVFIPIRQLLDANSDKYAAVCKKNKEDINKRWKKIPKHTTVYDPIRSDTKNTDIDIDIDKNIYKALWNLYISTSKSKEILTPLRKKKITARLKTFKQQDIEKAITNAYQDKFYSGDNDKGWKANFDYIFKSDEVMDRLINLTPRKRDGLSNEEIEARIS